MLVLLKVLKVVKINIVIIKMILVGIMVVNWLVILVGICFGRVIF